jgi:two-component system, chemotaxis family, response regulator PixG
MNNSGTFSKLYPLALLRQLSSCADSTYIQVLSNSVSWSIYLEQGKISYATHSIEPFDRLERHLRRLSHQIPTLSGEIRVQLRLMFEPDSQSQSREHPDYQAICWLLNQKHLQPTQAAVLIQELVKEVVESFLLIKEGTYELKQQQNRLPKICRIDVEKLLERCQDRLQTWNSLAPQISSVYQRPYLLLPMKAQQNKLPELPANLTKWMKGFSLRHLAVILNQDEMQLARILHPHILNGAIVLHEPDPPFDKLPKAFENLSESVIQITELVNKKVINSIASPPITAPTDHPNISVENLAIQEPLPSLSQINASLESEQQVITANDTTAEPPTEAPVKEAERKPYKIVSVDDSPTILKEISRLLEEESFSVVTISDPVKAVMSIIRHKPDLILLDLNMEGLDGYELCRIIRNNSKFKNTPIIMVTGNKGLVDKVKARLVGASGYLTKPFTRSELLKIVFMHLT